MRCPKCGVNYPGRDISYCSTCGFEFIPYVQGIEQRKVAYYEEPIVYDEHRLFSNPVDHMHQESLKKEGIFHQEPQLEGTIVAVDGPYLEPPDFDGAGLLLKLLMVILLAPVIIGIFVLYIAFSIPLSILGLGRVAGFMNPINILIAIGLFRGLFRSSRRSEDVPVRFLYLEDEAGNEYALRMKGHLRSGSLAPGHHIIAWGKWRDGVLHTRRAYNQRTGSNVVVKDNRWKWIVLGIITAIMAIIAILVLSCNSF